MMHSMTADEIQAEIARLCALLPRHGEMIPFPAIAARKKRRKDYIEMIILWILTLWANSAVLAIIVWSLYMAVWVWLHKGKYPTIAACREDFHRDGGYQVLSRWLYIEVLPALVALHLWRRYQAFLAYQQSLAQLRRMGRQVETYEHADGMLEVHCSTHGPVSREMIEQSQRIVEEGLQEL